jgi:hypothetical protein
VEKGARYALFVVVALGADTIEELATSAKIEAEVEIMGGLIVNEQLRIARGYREDIESTSK